MEPSIRQLEKKEWLEYPIFRYFIGSIPLVLFLMVIFSLNSHLFSSLFSFSYYGLAIWVYLLGGLIISGIFLSHLSATRRIIGESEVSDIFLLRLLDRLEYNRQLGLPSVGYVISGEGQPKAYSAGLQHKFEANRTVSLNVLVGPLILLNENDPKSLPCLFKMAREQFINLFIARRRTPVHFVSDGSSWVYREEPHEPSESRRSGFAYYSTQSLANAYKTKFRKLTCGKEPFGERLDLQNVEVCNKKVGFVTKNTLEALKAAINNQGKKDKTFNDYTLEDFKKLVQFIQKDDSTIAIKKYSELC